MPTTLFSSVIYVLKYLHVGGGMGGGGGDSCFLQRSTSFSPELGDAFQIFCCVAFEALLVAGIHAEMGPVVAVNFGGVLATSGTATMDAVIATIACLLSKTVLSSCLL